MITSQTGEAEAKAFGRKRNQMAEYMIQCEGKGDVEHLMDCASMNFEHYSFFWANRVASKVSKCEHCGWWVACRKFSTMSGASMIEQVPLKRNQETLKTPNTL